MSMRCTRAFALAAVALAAGAAGAPLAERLYTFIEAEDNDLCVDSQFVDASVAVAAVGLESARDCFYITGKLQEDCVWAVQPKCSVRALAKPLQCYGTNLAAIPGRYYEPLRATSDAFGRILNLAPDSHDRTIRLAVGAFMDALDGTVNGLNQNSRHTETGGVTIKLVYDGVDAAGPLPAGQNDAEYVFQLKNGADALRVSYVVPFGVSTVDIYCCNDTGAQPLCYDVDFYTVANLVPNRSYCVTVVGGLDSNCNKSLLSLGWFDKQWLQLPGVATGELAELCVLTDGEGALRFAVSGGSDFTDANFDGLADFIEADYRFFLFLLNALTGSSHEYRPGASVKDDSIDLVNRYPREVWDDNRFDTFFHLRRPPEYFFAHGVCAEYCIKIRLAEHVDPSERPDPSFIAGPQRADLNFDDRVNSLDLALLLSMWGPVPMR